jgi:lysophospholipid acyltransferase (LPLAT)-like uncharacterized protein
MPKRLGCAHDAMRALRPVLGHPLAQTILCWVIASYIRLVWRTGRWTIVDGEGPLALNRNKRPFIAAFWHGRLAMMPYALGGAAQNISVMISNHRDGRMIARAVRFFGITIIAGSTSKGGASAFRSAVRALRDNAILSITPDGPRGPRMRASDGVAVLARFTGAPVYPVAFSTSRRKVLGSWDRFVLPLPFSRGVFVWGSPIAADAENDRETVESMRLKIESALNAVTEKADRLTGQPVVMPAGDPSFAPAKR